MAVVALRGELDAYDAPAVKREVTAALAAGNDVVLDLRDASFVDSVVVGELLEAREEAMRHGVGFALALSDSRANHVRRILEQTNLIELFDVYDTPGKAAVSLRTRT
ncbi:MAG TPA: STAS domain-containing protein [Gaiellaceae bacterium]